MTKSIYLQKRFCRFSVIVFFPTSDVFVPQLICIVYVLNYRGNGAFFENTGLEKTLTAAQIIEFLWNCSFLNCNT